MYGHDAALGNGRNGVKAKPQKPLTAMAVPIRTHGLPPSLTRAFQQAWRTAAVRTSMRTNGSSGGASRLVSGRA